MKFTECLRRLGFGRRIRIVPAILTILPFFLGYGAQAALASGPHTLLKSASELDYPPFSIILPDGTAGGFSVELLQAAAEASGLSVSFAVGPWFQIKEELAEGKLDVLPLVSYSAARDKLYDFSAPYLRLNGTIFVRKDSTGITELADLKDKEVLVMRGDTAHEYVIAEQLTDNIITTSTYEEAFQLLAAGKHDALVVQQIVGLQILKQLNIKNVVPVQIKHVETLKPTPLQLKGFEQKFCFAVREGNTGLLSRLNEGLAITYLNGTYNTLYERWFSPILPEPKASTREIIKGLLTILLPVLLVIAVMGLWYFKQLVKKKTEHLLREVEQRREVEQALQEANTNYIKAQEIGKVGNWQYDNRKGQFTTSREANRIFGFASEPMKGSMTLEEMESCIVSRDDEQFSLLDLVLQGRPSEVEFEIRTADNGYGKTLLSFIEVETDTSGENIKVRGVIQDITERRKARKKLQQSESLLNEMGTIARIGGWEHDLLTCGANWTREIYNIVKIDTEPVPGPDEHLQYYLPEDRAVLEAAYRRAMESGESFDLELRCSTATGQLFWARVIGRPEFSEGKCIKMRGTFQDITEKKKMEEHLQQAQKLEAIGVLAGGIAHDFNNILSAILGFTELAKESNQANSQLQEDLGEIHTAGLRAKELVQQILSFSRKNQPSNSPIDVAAIVGEAMKLLRSTLPADIAIELDITSDQLPVMADPTNIHQIVMNICTNAGQAMEHTGGTLSVKVAEADVSNQFFQEHPKLGRGRYLELRFGDTGTGIDREIRDLIFDPYFTTKNLGDGTGLGLAVTHGLVFNMGGVILVESKPGDGSVFTIYLPIAEKAFPTTDGVSADQTAQKSDEHILLVDDEAAILKLLKRMLERHGYAVTAELDGMAALKRFNETPFGFDLVISDVGMPGISGDRLAKMILKIRPDMPIILASGYSKKISEGTAEELGVKGILPKPASEKQVLEMVQKVCGKFRAR